MPFLGFLTGALAWIGMVIVDLCMSAALLYEVIWKTRDDPRRIYHVFQFTGRGLLVSALLMCASRWGWDIGLVVWMGLVVAGTFMVVFLMPYLSRLALGLVPQSLVLALSALGTQLL